MAHDQASTFDAAELVIALSHYDLGVIESLTPLTKGSRRSPKTGIVAERGKFLLKRRDAAHCDPERIRFAHALQAHLKRAGFPAPGVIPTRSGGRTFLRVGEHVYELFEFVAGQRYRATPAEAWSAGETLAEFHAAAASLEARGPVPRADYHDNAVVRRAFDSIREQAPGTEGAAAAGILQRLHRAYDAASRAAAACGLPTFPAAVIHCDWHPGNMLFREGRVAAVIDYDTARVSRRVIDVANGALQFSLVGGEDVRDWPDEPDLDRFGAFLSGYESRSRFQPGERDAIPPLMVEALIAEAVAPLARTGRFGDLPAGAILPVIERKAAWIEAHAEALSRRPDAATV
ncbi:MAG: phosphotransferase [Phycisphaerae bacterium]|nr:MAG: hypothetical protein EDS66_07095 [Planctomycetota bacterium]KAB2948633.1 MAG: phosphotransferase [Phycisphaerae bacterium]MBE7457783.1 phosphotransferase [Planctomycetia bacterium]MCK6463698.1 phosphotransferase [Phycisphaerae bacterium]MCL4717587.1 phosphotransferase [Phycisphaerae bacterium]